MNWQPCLAWFRKNWDISSTRRGVNGFSHRDKTEAWQGNTARFQQETAATRREVRAERKASKREEAEGINGRLHECIVLSPAIILLVVQ
jgi:hypothetical protein